MGTPAKVKEEKKIYPVYEMEELGKLIIPPEVIAQITYLHSHCGGNEWSGMLLYDVKKGNPSKPEDFELEVKHIFLMDIGTAASTDYETDGDIVDIYDEIPDAMSMKLGHVHTHHGGASYFSNVDTEELMDNVDKHNYYLSLVVNFSGNYEAKVVFLSDMHTTSKMNYTDDAGELKHFKQNKVEKHMVVIDMNIFYGGLGSFFSERLKAVKVKIKEKGEKERKEREAKYNGNSGYDFGRGGNHNSHFSLPSHNQRSIGSKIIPDKMTSWEIERLTKNLLMFDAELKTESNVYAVLHQIAKTSEAEMDLYYDYMLNHVERVTDAFFDNPLDNDEAILVLGEVIMCIKKYEGIPVLLDLINGIVENLELIISGYEADPEPDEEEKTISDQLEKMEKDMP